MEPNVVLVQLTDELFRKLGRNLLNFQRFEANLRLLAMYSSFESPLQGFASRWDEHIAELRASTMGTVAGRVQKTSLAILDDGEHQPEVSEPMVSFRASFATDTNDLAQLNAQLRDLVHERNKLVHHFAETWDSQSVDSTLQKLNELDYQRERLIPVFNQIQGMAKTLQETAERRAAFFASPEGEAAIEQMVLCLSPTVRVLADFAAASTDENGWACLSRAGNLVTETAAQDFEALKKERRCTLKAIMLATGAFEVSAQFTERGRRTVYRLRKE